MPSIYAHYKLALDIFPISNKRIEAILCKQHAEYLIGAQGPDFLYYYKPFHTESGSILADTIHKQSCRSFLETVLKKREEIPFKEDFWHHHPGHFAYLSGLLSHFVLDSLCHPYIDSIAKPEFDHNLIETEFDRYLMNLQPKKIKYKELLPYTDASIDVLYALFSVYPTISKRELKKALFYFVHIKKLFMANPLLQVPLKGVLSLAGIYKRWNGLFLPKTISPQSTITNQELDLLCIKAKELTPLLIQELFFATTHTEKLSALFDTLFE